jgi:prolyl oligopeptidase
LSLRLGVEVLEVVVSGLAALAVGTVVLMIGGVADDVKPKYPETNRKEVIDDYHGTRVPDPYRWLEDDVRVNKDVAEWVAEQNKVTSAYLNSIPEREPIKKRLTELWNFERFSPPSKHGTRYFYTKNDGLQNQSVLYVQEGLDAPAKVLIDPNTWSKDGTIALAETAISDDGESLAYAVADAGSDWRIWRVMEVSTGKLLPDELRWVKFSGATWTKDNKGFFYSRFDEPAPGQKFQSLNLNQKLYYHRLGQPQSKDVLVFYRPDQPKWSYSADVTEDGKYLVIAARVGTDPRYRIMIKDLEDPYAAPWELVPDFENLYNLAGNDGPRLFFHTDLNAPRGRVIAVDLRKPERKNWREIIPQAAETLRGVGVVGGQFVCNYLKDAHSQVKLFDLKGRLVREVEFPGLGTAGGFGGRQIDTETFYTFSSFATPPSIYRYNLLTGTSELFRKSNVKFNPDDYDVKQIFYTSKDGTKVPMFLTHKKGIKLDGNNPTLLYGYGGFNIPMTPGFAVQRVGWLEMGGVLAVANLRGGGEYGKEWHQAGTKQKKQNVFDDFISAAEWLIKERYTATPKLAIQGGSNGGLLIGACMTQRPDLFGACLPAVGVMDMLRFQKFTAGRYWTDDYGSSDNPEEFQALFKYSPYHNIKPGTNYPATLVTTADTDDRVVPGHSFKFIAALQYAQSGNAPVLARIETRAGHGAGTPTSKIIEEYADLWGFLVKTLDMKLPEGFGK